MLPTKVLWIAYANVLLYAFCFRIQARVQPATVQILINGGHDLSDYHYVDSFNQMMQLLGSLCLGIFVDAYGMRSTLLVCFTCSGLSYATIGVSNSVTHMILSKAFTFFQHGMLLGQTQVLQEAKEKDRAGALGRLHLMYMIGSTMAGKLTDPAMAIGGHQFCSAIAVAGSMCSIVLCIMLPVTVADELDDAGSGAAVSPAPAVFGRPSGAVRGALPIPMVMRAPMRLLGLAKTKNVASRSLVLLLLALLVGTRVTSTMRDTALPFVISTGPADLQPKVWYMFDWARWIYNIVILLAIGPICQRFRSRAIVPVCLAVKVVLEVFVMLLLMPIPVLMKPSVYIYKVMICVAVFLFNFGNVQLLDTVALVFLTSAVKKDERGTLMGFLHAFFDSPFGGAAKHANVALYGLFNFAGIWFGTAATSIGLLLMTTKLILPKYRTKDE